jgi:hypothetical protein
MLENSVNKPEDANFLTCLTQSPELRTAIIAREWKIASPTDQVASLRMELKTLRSKPSLPGSLNVPRPKRGRAMKDSPPICCTSAEALSRLTTLAFGGLKALAAARQDLNEREREVRELRLQNSKLGQRTELSETAETCPIDSA